MMTNEEAVYILKNAAWLGSIEDRIKTETAVDLAVEALEKQIPVKPNMIPDEDAITGNYYCPKCGYYYGTRGFRNVILFDRPPYCKCGQAIDWSE